MQYFPSQKCHNWFPSTSLQSIRCFVFPLRTFSIIFSTTGRVEPPCICYNLGCGFRDPFEVRVFCGFFVYIYCYHIALSSCVCLKPCTWSFRFSIMSCESSGSCASALVWYTSSSLSWSSTCLIEASWLFWQHFTAKWFGLWHLLQVLPNAGHDSFVRNEYFRPHIQHSFAFRRSSLVVFLTECTATSWGSTNFSCCDVLSAARHISSVFCRVRFDSRSSLSRISDAKNQTSSQDFIWSYGAKFTFSWQLPQCHPVVIICLSCFLCSEVKLITLEWYVLSWFTVCLKFL